MTNPYTLLRIPPEAATDEIEAAYERLFDRYEARAQSGDTEAASILEQLNDAYDTLLDPDRRAALDAQLVSGGRNGRDAAAPRLRSRAQAQVRSPQAAAAPATGNRSIASSTGSTGGSLRVKARTRDRYREVETARPFPLMPIFLIGMLGFALAALVTYMLVLRNDSPQAVTYGVPQVFVTGGTDVPQDTATSRGSIVATVNGQPIYQQDFLERAEMDKNAALEDPMFGIYFQTLAPYSQTQALETLRSDSLDRLINFEVLMQQAVREGKYPTTPEQQRELINSAKTSEVKEGSFADFLKKRNLTEGQYNRRIIRNVVYSVMADAHTPKTGTAEARRNAFFQWICQTRQGYDVQIKITFTLATPNPPCTSDLPPELPIPGVDTSAVPGPEETSAPPRTPAGTPSPQGPPAPPNK